MKTRILLVTDGTSAGPTLGDGLSGAGYEVAVAAGGEDALARAAGEPFDLVVLDGTSVDLPGELRRRGLDVRILQLDDPPSRPLETAELLARVEACLSRPAPEAPGTPCTYRFGHVHVDFERAEVERNGRRVALSATEARLLRCLIEHRGATLSRVELLGAVCGERATPSTRTVDVHVAWLRKKVEAHPRLPRYILTVHGIGYKFVG